MKIVRIFYCGAVLCMAGMPVATKSVQSVAIIGTGYVGLVSAAGLAEFGNTVIAADIDASKISILNAGGIPIYEPGLASIVQDNVARGVLTFTTDMAAAIKSCDVIMIAVGTPMGEDGSADMSYVASVVNTIAQTIDSFKYICVKSTVPVGTGAWIRGLLEEQGVPSDLFSMVSNPEFLREGTAVTDFLYPDRVVVGTESSEAADVMRDMYAPLVRAGIPLITTSVVSSETIKYASNAFLAVKVSFINEIANLCDATGADVKDVAYAMGSDRRISPHFLRPGPGFGGSCFPKDSSALLYIAHKYGVNLQVVEGSLEANEAQKEIPVKKLMHLMHNDVQGKTIAIWGLAFKANTDDVRYSPAIVVMNELIDAGATIQAFDPAGSDNMKKLIPSATYCKDMYEAIQGADALVVMTEWGMFGTADLSRVAQAMNDRVVVDARGVLDIEQLRALGFTFDLIGRSCVANAG